jgi:bifunctional DNA-binding transcriptional regulator/antitoxin component of YhaV-PrlF toxin-antitoxin module
MARYKLVRISRLVQVHDQLALYLPKKAEEALGLKKGDEVRILLDESEKRLLIEKNEALKLGGR